MNAPPITVKKLTTDQTDSYFTDVLPRYLYKYREWDKVAHKTVITNQISWFAHPETFEDLKDCRLPLDFDSVTDWIRSNVYRDTIETSLKTHHKEDLVKYWYEERFSTEKKRELFLKFFHRTFNDTLGILSLCKKKDSADMWGKYGKNFTGFCVGYDFSKGKEWSLENGVGITSIDYTKKELPTLNWFKDYNDENFMETYASFIIPYISIKTDDWRFEDEHRFWKLIYKSLPADHHMNKRDVKTPKDFIKEVIFGEHLPPASRDEIIKACILEKLHPHIYEAKSTGSDKVELIDLGIIS